MCRRDWRRLVGIASVSFGGGILLSFLLPWYILAFLEAAVVVIGGVLLMDRRP